MKYKDKKSKNKKSKKKEEKFNTKTIIKYFVVALKFSLHWTFKIIGNISQSISDMLKK